MFDWVEPARPVAALRSTRLTARAALQDVTALVRNERLGARMGDFARHAQLGYAQGGAAWSGDYAGSGCGRRLGQMACFLLLDACLQYCLRFSCEGGGAMVANLI